MKAVSKTDIHVEKIVLYCEILVICSTPSDKMYKAEDFTDFMTTVKTELKNTTFMVKARGSKHRNILGKVKHSITGTV